MSKNKMTVSIVLTINLLLFSTIIQAEDFLNMLIKGIAVELVIEGLKSAYASRNSSPQSYTPQNLRSISPNETVKSQVQEIILKLLDSNQPLSQKINLYAERVDFFKEGVVSKNYIRDNALKYMKKFPSRSYIV